MLPRFRPTRFALAASLALLGSAAFAAPVLSAATTAEANNAFATTTPNVSGGYTSSSSNATSLGGGPDQASSFAFATQYGAYAVSSRAVGIGSATANATLLYTLTNTASFAQGYSMSFHIYGGSISTYLASGQDLVVGESLASAYAASIKVGSTTLFNSSAALATTLDGSSLTKSGTTLNDGGDNGTDGTYSWGAGDYLIDLGILAAGASIDILAEVSNSVASNVGTYSFSSGGGSGYDNGYGSYGGYGGYGGGDVGYGFGDGYGGTVDGGCENIDEITGGCVGATVTAPKGGAESFYGDPIEFLASGPDTGLNAGFFTFNITTEPPPPPPPGGDVPEPATLGLFGLALAAASVATRRRRKAA